MLITKHVKHFRDADPRQDLRNIHLALNWKERNNYGSRRLGIAQTLVRAATELQKQNEKRFREFADSALPQLKQYLFSAAPLYDDLETTLLAFNLTKMREQLTTNDPYVKKVLGNQSPAQLAVYLINNTKLGDVIVREQIFNGGAKAIAESEDPLIQLVLRLDPEGRETHQKYEDDGQWVKPWTTSGGAFDHATGAEPFDLPEIWSQAKSDLAMETKFNFCSTNDIIGGNSGSPVVNKEAEVVGLIFDGNLRSLGGDYGYEGATNRAVAIHSASVIDLLKKVYHADRIVNDLQGTQKSP